MQTRLTPNASTITSVMGGETRQSITSTIDTRPDPMPHRLYHTLEAVLALATSLSALASSHLMLAEAQTNQVDELRLLLLPLMGALIVSGGMIMLNPSVETRKVIIGRAIIGLFFGATGPQVLALFHDKLSGLTSHPVLLLVFGGLLCGLFFVLAKPFVQGLYKRSQRVAEAELDRLEKKFGPDKEP